MLTRLRCAKYTERESESYENPSLRSAFRPENDSVDNRDGEDQSKEIFDRSSPPVKMQKLARIRRSVLKTNHVSYLAFELLRTERLTKTRPVETSTKGSLFHTLPNALCPGLRRVNAACPRAATAPMVVDAIGLGSVHVFVDRPKRKIIIGIR